MQKLIILRGNSGSGKTTVAKELQNRFGENTMLISQDMIRRDILKVKDGENTLALLLMKELLIYGNQNSDIVILEGIMYSEWYRPLFRLTVELYNERIYAYYFDLPFEETIERYKTKSAEVQNRFYENDMRRWYREKDFSDVLNKTRITSDKSKENIVTEIYNDVVKI